MTTKGVERPKSASNHAVAIKISVNDRRNSVQEINDKSSRMSQTGGHSPTKRRSSTNGDVLKNDVQTDPREETNGLANKDSTVSSVLTLDSLLIKFQLIFSRRPESALERALLKVCPLLTNRRPC